MAHNKPSLTRQRSIRAILLGLLLPAALVFMGAAWLVHGALLDRMARTFVEDRLAQEAQFLEQQLRDSSIEGKPTLSAGRYFEEVFHHAHAIRYGQQQTISPATWQPALEPLLEDAADGFIDKQISSGLQAGPTHFLAYRSTVDINGQRAIILVAEDLTALHHGQQELHIWTAVVSGGLLLMLGAVIFLAVTLALRSVRNMQQELAALQHGQRLRLSDEAASEFRPLTGQINELLDTLDQRLERSRLAVANLSHSVKTPIAAVKQLLTDYQRPLDLAMREQMADRLADITRQLETEMSRSRFAGPQIGKAACPVLQARDLLWTLGRLHPDKHFELDTKLDSEQTWGIEEQDLGEILGNLLDNAGKWARFQALLNLAIVPGAGGTSDALRIQVSDDGPGVEARERSGLGTRGLRLDEQTPGHGLGLAIVQEIVARYSGSITFDVSHAGGLKVLVVLPGTIGK
ncbi:MAG: sensor histidine kinase [Marinobacter sp.]|uniref:ATP-binding protein n=1 Tax=Marinobacter sp. TaxID=50741 RepID=UPI0034A08009